MMQKHLSSQFDAELNTVSARVMELGGLVESQIGHAIRALSHFSLEAVETVATLETRVNALEVDIDRELSTIIARRQPTARDLRLLMAFSKATANLERMGDEASKMARMVRSIIETGAPRNLPTTDRLDTRAALAILKEDDLIDEEFDGFVRKLVTYMMEDPRTISPSLDLLFIAKAIERIGDHSKNVAELIIYLVEGTDVRHTSLEDIESVLR